MARRVTTDTLGEVVKELLEDYDVSVTEEMKEAVKRATKEGVKVVRANSKAFGGTGRYAKGWTSQVETGMTSAQGTIYNADLPGLPHLLEHGHAKRNGGRVPGRVHIAPVQEKLTEVFTNELGRSI